MDAFSPAAFLGIVAVASATPGPSMVLAMEHGMRFGVRGAAVTALGNVAATLVQVLLSLAGLDLLGLGSPALLAGLRHLGALYLAFLGIQALRTRGTALSPQGPLDEPHRAAGPSLRCIPPELAAGAQNLQSPSPTPRRFATAFLVTLGNPKAIVFFVALFPSMLASGPSSFLGLAGLVTSILLITFVCMMLYAGFGQGLMAALGEPRGARVGRWLVGASFMGFAGWMVLHGN